MNIKNTMLGMLAATSLTLALGAGASAVGLTAIDVSGGNTTAANVFYNQGSGLTISNTVNNTGFLQGKVGQGRDNSVTINFPLLANASGYTLSGGNFDQPLAGSSFTITSLDKVGNPVLLSGTFGSADLTGTVGSAGGLVNLKLNSLTYDPSGLFFPAGYSPFNGSLSVEFTAAKDIASGNSGIVATATGVHSFTANDGITYSAQPPAVPEPGSLALLAVGVPGVLSLMLRARKVRRTSGLSA